MFKYGILKIVNRYFMRLIDAVIAVTYNCNSRCQMCNIWKNKGGKELAVSEYSKLPKTLKYINLTGGEPFLRKDLPAIVEVVKKRCPNAQVTISSNGLTTEMIVRQLEKILAINPDIAVSLSLDAVGDLHGKIRGVPGGYDKIMRTFKAIKKLGIKNIRLAFTAGDYNINHLNKVYDLAEKLGVQMTLAAVHNAENYFQTKDNQIKDFETFKKEFKTLIKKELKSWNLMRWARAFFAHGLLYFILNKKRLLPAFSGHNSFFLDPLGNVYPADISSKAMGNIKEYKGFDELYNSTQAKKVLTDDKSAQNSWMICTIRPTVRKYWFRIGLWVVKNKFLK